MFNVVCSTGGTHGAGRVIRQLEPEQKTMKSVLISTQYDLKFELWKQP